MKWSITLLPRDSSAKPDDLCSVLEDPMAKEKNKPPQIVLNTHMYNIAYTISK